MFSPFNSIHGAREWRLAAAGSILAFLGLLTNSVLAQDLPKTIRGYKVHEEKIEVANSTEGSFAEAKVNIGEPQIIDASLTGFTFELPADILAAKQSGRVDLLTFRGVKVNGISVNVEDYAHQFEFRKGERVSLPKPARMVLPVTGIMQAAWNEMRDSHNEWTVSGRMFVFGRFRKFGFYHKRVVPVDFEIKIKNPLRND